MTKLRYGMIGGDLTSFIGNVHRSALRLDPRVELVCGCFSRDIEKSAECGESVGISRDRIYTDWREMVKAETAKGEEKIDFVTVCTPNHIHYEVSKAFLLAGINVVCEKPLCFEVSEAEELCAIAEEKGLVFAVMYTYTGYNMIKVMRQMIRRGDIGEIISVNAVYAQNCFLNELYRSESTNDKKWRTDPRFSGIGNTIGDIGVHAQNLVGYVTGLKIKRLCATVDRFGKQLDYNDNVLVEYENGVHGAYWCSQVAAGKQNGLSVGIYGTKGAIEWHQQYPDYLRFTRHDEPTQILSRGGSYLDVAAAQGSRIPAGHPEGYICAYADTYRNIANLLVKRKEGTQPTEEDLDFQTGRDGCESVRFIHAVIRSGDNASMWVGL